MPIFTIEFREGPDIAVEGAQVTFTYPDGTHAAMVYIMNESKQFVAIIPSDALRAIYLQEAGKETK